MKSSPSVAQMLTHIHYVRLIFVLEDAPEFAREVPKEEWLDERDPDRIAQIFIEQFAVRREGNRPDTQRVAPQDRLAPGGQVPKHVLDRPSLIWRGAKSEARGEPLIFRHRRDDFWRRNPFSLPRECDESRRRLRDVP